MHQGEAPVPRLRIAALMRPRAIIAEEVGEDERAGAILAQFGAPVPSERTVRKILWEVLLWSSEGRQLLVPFVYDAGRFPTVRAVLDHLAAEALIALSSREDGAGVWALNAADRLCWEDALHFTYQRHLYHASSTEGVIACPGRPACLTQLPLTSCADGQPLAPAGVSRKVARTHLCLRKSGYPLLKSRERTPDVEQFHASRRARFVVPVTRGRGWFSISSCRGRAA